MKAREGLTHPVGSTVTEDQQHFYLSMNDSRPGARAPGKVERRTGVEAAGGVGSASNRD